MIHSNTSRYLSGPQNYSAAVLVEAGECLDSTSFCWWKKVDEDVENIKTELVDILHFLISEALQKAHKKNEDIKDIDEYNTKIVDKVYKQFLIAFDPTSAPRLFTNKHEFLQRLVKSLGIVGCNTLPIIYRIRHLEEACSLVNMSLDEVYSRYMVKNALNLFRQKNGYKEGTYVKYFTDLNVNITERNEGTVAKEGNLNLKDYLNSFYEKQSKLNYIENVYEAKPVIFTDNAEDNQIIMALRDAKKTYKDYMQEYQVIYDLLVSKK
jgi:dimeric dUTPase (all-alpha-NTP-PPase superfamily)